LRERAGFLGMTGGRHTSAAKARVDSAASIPGLKSRPTARTGLSAGFEARTLQTDPTADARATAREKRRLWYTGFALSDLAVSGGLPSDGKFARHRFPQAPTAYTHESPAR